MKEECGKKWIVCVAATIGIVILIILAVVILAFTVFKAKEIISTVDSIEVHDMDMGFSMFTMSLNMNVTLDVIVSVKNPNVYGLKYYNGSTQINYRGQLIGEAPIPSGEISRGQTKRMNLTLTLMADRVLSNKHILSDVSSNTMPLSSFMKVTGEVNVLGLTKIHAKSISSCNFTLKISNKTIENKVCRYKKVV
ncbi:unnamed protein product [Vicia faba]|uniref:Late embryogenesis abundant protein LEA-2 subgroup domain-containing protein n=1 Tax=Vicia faba TaxID=3906 RepID=A0AAV0YLC5_VICFA|nr:unnamed protein product [Vicia faba]